MQLAEARKGLQRLAELPNRWPANRRLHLLHGADSLEPECKPVRKERASCRRALPSERCRKMYMLDNTKQGLQAFKLLDGTCGTCRHLSIFFAARPQCSSRRFRFGESLKLISSLICVQMQSGFRDCLHPPTCIPSQGPKHAVQSTARVCSSAKKKECTWFFIVSRLELVLGQQRAQPGHVHIPFSGGRTSLSALSGPSAPL